MYAIIDGEIFFFDEFKTLLKEVVDNGEVVKVERANGSSVRTYEVVNFTARLDPTKWMIVDPGRHFNVGLALWEFVTLITGDDSLKGYERFSPNFGKFSTSKAVFSGSYAPRVSPHLHTALMKLIRHEHSRQAVLNIYSTNDLYGPWMDVRCAVSVQFLIRGGRLNTIVNMRSNDAFLGFMTDQAMFSLLANYAAAFLDVPIGPLWWNASSFHVYDYHVDKLDMMSGTPNMRVPEFPDTTNREKMFVLANGLQGAMVDMKEPLFNDFLKAADLVANKKPATFKSAAFRQWALAWCEGGGLW